MLLRNQPRNRNRQFSIERRSIDPTKCDISMRTVHLAFFLLTVALAFQSPKCMAAASGAIESAGPTEGDGPTVGSVNLAIDAQDTAQSDAAARPAGPGDDSITQETEHAPAFAPGHSALAVNGPPSGIVKFDENTIDASPSRKCIFFAEGLCRATKNKPILALTAVQTAALVSDGVTTRQFLRRGYTEVEPLARILIGRKPTWGRMAPLGAVQVVAGMWLADRMAASQNAWVRRFWWLPQVMGIAGNAAATGHNFTLR